MRRRSFIASLLAFATAPALLSLRQRARPKALPGRDASELLPEHHNCYCELSRAMTRQYVAVLDRELRAHGAGARLLPSLLAACTLLLMGGCASQRSVQDTPETRAYVEGYMAASKERRAELHRIVQQPWFGYGPRYYCHGPWSPYAGYYHLYGKACR